MSRPDDRCAAVDAAIVSRRSVRAFLPTPVDRETIEAILSVASRAPSGTNMQPWRVTVLTGAALARFRDAVCEAFDSGETGKAPYRYYPEDFFEPYLGRRRKVGWDLYGTLDIKKGDTVRMRAQYRRNFRFFDAPVGMIVSIDRRLGIGSWLDLGMFVENILIAARGRGLDTCPQAAFASYHGLIARHLELPETDIVVCGIALGGADPDAPENGLVTDREPTANFVRFCAD